MNGPIFRLLPLFSAVVASFGLNAQVWCPAGSKWTYTDSSMLSNGISVYEYVSDTMVDGVMAKKLIHTWNVLVADTVQHLPQFSSFTYQDGPVVYYKMETGVDWDTLFRFDAVPGDFWYTPHSTVPEECKRIVVVDTGSIIIHGFSLRYLDYTIDSLGTSVIHRFTERIGDRSFHVILDMCDAQINIHRWLRCYQDDEFGLYSAGIAPACDHQNSVWVALREEADLIFPNPGSGHFTLSLPPGTHTITLFDATGRAVLRQKANADLVTFDTARLPSGLYVVRVDDGVRPMRWVKE